MRTKLENSGIGLAQLYPRTLRTRASGQPVQLGLLQNLYGFDFEHQIVDDYDEVVEEVGQHVEGYSSVYSEFESDSEVEA